MPPTRTRPAVSALLALLSITGLWVIVNFWSGTALYSFTLYVFDERGWTARDLVLLPLGTIPLGLLGYSLAGFAMDRIGRIRSSNSWIIIAREFFLVIALFIRIIISALS